VETARGGIVGRGGPFEDQPVSLVGTRLRFELALDAADPKDTAATLISLTASPDPEDRAQAAWSLYRAIVLLPAEGETMLRLLARDRSPDVRAAAGSTLAGLGSTPAGGDDGVSAASGEDGRARLAAAFLPETSELLHDPGTTPTLAVLDALGSLPVGPPPALRDDIAQLGRVHASGRVRAAAGTLIG
jgi:HEAT repeat protein